MERQLRTEGWTTVEGVAVRGRAFDCRADRCERSSLLSGTALAARFRAAADRSKPTEIFDAICEVTSNLEGFFAVIIDETVSEQQEKSYLIADGARSIPLYYDGNGSVVSDRGHIVQRAIDAERDPITESELLLTRYVTGPETIWSRIYVIQPGEVVALPTTRRRSQTDIVRRTYREYRPTTDREIERTDTKSAQADTKQNRPDVRTDRNTPLQSITSAKATLRAGFETALDRTERIAGERPIVVPLSGGYDSRLLAASLVERDREVIGFTFGRSGHPDVEMSREVAAALDIEWHHVTYSESDWKRWYHGADCRRYRANAFGDSLPFLAEWPALRTLIEKHRLPENALFCPGHAVTTPSERLPDFTDGSTDTLAIKRAERTDEHTDEPAGEFPIDPTVSDLTEYILNTHYTLWDWENHTFRTAARRRIRRGLLGDRDPTAIAGPDSAAAAYERWEWRGRMAAFTNGDLRVYDDVSVDWWLPLWDPAYVRAWEQLPLAYRHNRRLHIELAIEQYLSAASRSLSKSEAARTDRTLSGFDRSLSLLRYTPTEQFVREKDEWLPSFLAPRSQWGTGNHPLAWYGAVDPALLERLPDFRDFYALRVLAETGRLDLSDAQSPVPGGKSIELPSVEETRKR